MMSERAKKILLYAVACPAFFLFSLLFGAYWTFPYDHLRDFIVQEAERDGSTRLEIVRLRPSWVTGIELEGVRLTSIPEEAGRTPRSLQIRHATARISLLSLLGGTQEVSFDAEIDGGGTIEGVFAQSEDSTHIEAAINDVDLRRLGPLHDMVGLPLAGRATGNVNLTIAREAANTEGSAELTVRGVSVGDGQTPLVIEGMGAAGLTLERMNLGALTFRMQVQRGEATVQQLRADGEHAELQGSGTIRLVQPLRMSSLNLLVRVKLKDAYRESSPRMTGLMMVLEQTPQVRPARTSDGGFQWRIQGSAASRVRMIPAGREPMPGAN